MTFPKEAEPDLQEVGREHRMLPGEGAALPSSQEHIGFASSFMRMVFAPCHQGSWQCLDLFHLSLSDLNAVHVGLIIG